VAYVTIEQEGNLSGSCVNLSYESIELPIADFATGDNAHTFPLSASIMNSLPEGDWGYRPDLIAEPDAVPIVSQMVYTGKPNRYQDNTEIYLLSSVSDQERRLTSMDKAAHPSLSPDGQWVAFSSDVPDDLRTIFIRPVADHFTTSENQFALAWGDHPTWSPDGQRIAYIGYGGDLEIRNSNGSGSIQYVNLGSGFQTISEVKWSPADNHLVITVFGALYTVDLDAVTPTAVLLTNDGTNINPSWSPDGSQIVFASNRDNGYFNLFIMNADGSGTPENITNSTDRDDVAPTWSTDGMSIGYTSTLYGENDTMQESFRILQQESAAASPSLRQNRAMAMTTLSQTWHLAYRWERAYVHNAYWQLPLFQGPSQTPTDDVAHGLYGEYYNGFSVLDTPAVRPTDSMDFHENWALPEEITNKSQFSVRWTGQIKYALPDVVAGTPTPTPTEGITPTATASPGLIDLTLCVQTSNLGVNTEAKQDIKLWIGGNAVAITNDSNQKYCGVIHNIDFDGMWHDIALQYWRFAPPDTPDLPLPTLQLRWQATKTGDNQTIYIQDNVIPVNRLKSLKARPTTNMPNSLQDWAVCTPTAGAKQVTVVPVFAGVSQEAKDMGAIANGSGLLIHDGPTLNSAHLSDSIPWGRHALIESWMKFDQAFLNDTSQLVNLPSLVWYKVTGYDKDGNGSIDSNEMLSTEDDYWVAARISDARGFDTNDDKLINYSQAQPSFLYTVGAGEDIYPCKDDIAAYTGTLKFSFDGNRAIQVALAQSNNNRSLVGHKEPYSRVTRRISGVPFADF
jgi:hypothetical protein